MPDPLYDPLVGKQPAALKQATIAAPSNSIESLMTTVNQLKEAVEVLMAQRGDPMGQPVTWRDLQNLGLLKQGQVPNVASHRVRRRG